MGQLLQFLQTASAARDIVVAVLGLLVGSFLNVLALRSLAEKNIWWPPSHCPKCEHKLSVLDLIPVVSWMMLGGKCRYCKASISWQYPVVEIITAMSFVTIVRYFGFNFEGAGMLVFMCTLIAVCVTDFREKLIPHEITYPSMLMGIIYSGVCANLYRTDPSRLKHDLLGTMAGIGISYILFDFLAFYGLKIYMLYHPQFKDAKQTSSTDPENKNSATDSDLAPDSMAQDVEDVDDEIDCAFDLTERTKESAEDAVDLTESTKKSAEGAEQSEDEEQFEVMGGGDAVLSAVIAAWLGLPRLGTALLFGFLAGTVMGACYLLYELIRNKMLSQCIVPSVLATSAFLALFEGMVYIYSRLMQVPFWDMAWLQFAIASIIAGSLTGIVLVGSRVSKPFPFGPALAAGALVAMFYDPFTNTPGGA